MVSTCVGWIIEPNRICIVELYGYRPRCVYQMDRMGIAGKNTLHRIMYCGLRLVHSACTGCVYLPHISPHPSAHSSPVSIVCMLHTLLPTSYPTPSLGTFVSGQYTIHVPATFTCLIFHLIPQPTRLRLVHYACTGYPYPHIAPNPSALSSPVSTLCMYRMYLPASYLTPSLSPLVSG
jgi:hypothetical protein